MARGRLFDPGRNPVGGRLTFPFEYVPSHKTDVRATIERAKLEQAKQPRQVVKLGDRRRK